MSQEMIIHAGAINRDYMHMLISIPTNLSVSKGVQYLKVKSSHKLLAEYKLLRKRYWEQHLWARGYWVASSGDVADEVWKKRYHQSCRWIEVSSFHSRGESSFIQESGNH